MNLENALMKRETSFKINASDDPSDCDFEITFEDMKERNVQTSDVTDVRRQGKADSIGKCTE